MDLKVTADLARFAALPFYFHRRPDTQGQHRDKGIAEIVLYLHHGHPIGVEAVADGRRDLFGLLDQAPEKRVGGPGVHFCAWLGMSGDTVGVAAAE